jgi:hypothetical protein
MNTQPEQVDDDVEQVLRRTRFTTPAALDERILADATRELRTASAAPRFRVPVRFRRRAAIVLLAVGAVAALFAYLDRPNLTLAQVAAEFQKQSWVHLTYDNGREEWANLTDGRTFFKDHDGRVVYTEPAGLRLVWRPQLSYISRDKWFTGGVAPPQYATTAWDRYVQTYGVPSGAKPDGMTPHDDVLDDKKVVRFDAHFIDALGRRVLVKQVWADPITKLPLRIRDVLDLRDRNEQKRDAIVGTFAFPATGPSSIHDLGVPNDAPIVDSDAKPTGAVADIFAAAKAASAKFPQRWRIVRWNESGDGEADVEYRDGVRRASARWFQLEVKDYPNLPKSPATAEQVLAWMRTRPPIDQKVSTVDRDYSRQNPIPGITNNIPEPTARVMVHTDWGDDINFPPGMQWAYAKWSGPATKVDPPPAGVPAGLVVVRREISDQRTDYWVDPAKDHACVRSVEQRRIKDGWKTSRIDSLDGWVRLPGGDWFATIKKHEGFGVFPNLRDNPYVELWRSDITLMNDDGDFPPGTFDGEPLLKGAKLESY